MTSGLKLCLDFAARKDQTLELLTKVNCFPLKVFFLGVFYDNNKKRS